MFNPAIPHPVLDPIADEMNRKVGEYVLSLIPLDIPAADKYVLICAFVDDLIRNVVNTEENKDKDRTHEYRR